MGEKTQIYSCLHNMVVLTSLVEIPCPHGCIQDTHTIHTAIPTLSSEPSIPAVRTQIGQQRTEPWPESLAMITAPCTRGRSFHIIGCKGVQLPSQALCARSATSLLPPHGTRNISLFPILTTWMCHLGSYYLMLISFR